MVPHPTSPGPLPLVEAVGFLSVLLGLLILSFLMASSQAQLLWTMNPREQGPSPAAGGLSS